MLANEYIFETFLSRHHLPFLPSHINMAIVPAPAPAVQRKPAMTAAEMDQIFTSLSASINDFSIGCLPSTPGVLVAADDEEETRASTFLTCASTFVGYTHPSCSTGEGKVVSISAVSSYTCTVFLLKSRPQSEPQFFIKNLEEKVHETIQSAFLIFFLQTLFQ